MENLGLHINYSYLTMNEPIIATPEQQLNFSSTYKWENFSINLALQHINNLYTQTTPAKQKESYTLINARLAYTINEYVDIFIKAENLADEKYYINFGYPMPGFVTFGGINLHY
jgi:iron complex outermembrane receptor protein